MRLIYNDLTLGKSRTMIAQKLSVRGSYDQDHIVISTITNNGERLKHEAAIRLFELPSKTNSQSNVTAPTPVKKIIENETKMILDELAALQSAWFDDEMDKFENWAEEKRADLKADLREVDD